MTDGMNDTVRWGILSTANIGRKVVTPALQASHNGKVVAVASRSAAQAEGYAKELGIKRFYGDYDALLADPDVDAIYIPLPNSLHKPWTLRALEVGKHVLCEKPLGLNAQECLDMHAVAAQNGRVLMEAFMYRFHPRTERALEHLRIGTLGDLKLVRAGFTFTVSNPDNIRLQPDLGGGALMDVGCYCVNAGRTLLGREPVEAQAFAVWSEQGVDKSLVGVLRFEGDVFVQFHCALDTARQEFVEVVGSGGRIRLESAFLPGLSDAVIETVRSGGKHSEETISGADEYRLMGEHFADCVLNGTEPRYSALEAAANMAALGALYKSARNGGKPVEVEQL
ncbi:Gfo/Idh/MocA family oxidoreductase [soil metagenome]